MKFYNTPEIETLKFAIAEDVICTSGMNDSNTDNGGVGNGDSTGVGDEDVFEQN